MLNFKPQKTGIILVNYQDYAQHFLEACRDSLRLQSYPENYRSVYIVDNASSEVSFNYLKECFPEAIILTRSDGNYAAANNLGVKQAIVDGCECLVIANMDTVFTENWLEELVRASQSSSDIGLVQSKILLFREDGKRIINSLGNRFHFLGFGFTSEYGSLDREIKGYPEIKGYASGCSFLIKKEVFEKIGGYFEEFYMYHDDVDIGLKARLAGYKIILAPQSVVYHKYEFKRSIRMLYYMERNRLFLLLAFYRPLTLFLVLPFLLIMELGMLVYSLLGKWLPIKLKVCGYFLNPINWRKISTYRRNLRQIDKGYYKNIICFLASRIEFQEINNPVLRYLVNPLMFWYWRLVLFIQYFN